MTLNKAMFRNHKKGKGMMLQMIGTNLTPWRGSCSQSKGQHMGRVGGVSEKQRPLRTGLGKMLSGQWSLDE